MRFRLILALVTALVSIPSFAQSPVLTIPAARPATNVSTTIAVTNTFQQVLAANTARTGCTIQNKSTADSMYVYIGTAAGATIAKSVKLAAGQAVYCTSGDGIALTDAVHITGTATDAFYAAYW